MPATAETIEGISLSAKFIVADEEPLTCVALLEGCDLHEGAVLKAKVQISANGGASRTVVRPVIKSVGDASGIELADQLHAIAWNDCKKHGAPRRYLAELIVKDESQPVRIYFDLSPDVPTLVESGNTGVPSLEYVRGLEQLVLTLSTNASRVSVRQGLNEEKRINAVWAGLDRQSHLEIAKGQVAVAQIAEEGRNRRMDKGVDGIVTLLPKLAERYLPPAAAAAVATAADGTPIERIEKLVTADQFSKLETALGKESWVELSAAPDLPTAKNVLANLSLETQSGMLEAIGRDHLLTMAGWS